MGRDGAGWKVLDMKSYGQAGRRWKARALDPKRKKYTYKCFPEKMEDESSGYVAAEDWAKAMHSRLRSGLDSTGKVSLTAIAKNYIEQLEQDGRCKEHRREIDRVVKSLDAAGIVDMQAKDFPLRVKSHLVAWRDAHKFRCARVDKEGKLILFQRGPRKGKPKREGRALGAQTRHRYLGHIKAIARFAVTWDYLAKNPMDKVQIEKGESSKPSFTVDEFRLLVAPGKERFWLPFLGMAYEGLRLAEAMHLRWEWIDWGANRLHIKKHPAYRLKRNKERSVPLQPEYRAILEKRKRDIGWIIDDAELRRITGAEDPDRKKAWIWFHDYVDGRGVTCGERSPHSTRHTWIPLMMAAGEDSAFVQIWAGHSEIETTMGYSKVRDEMRAAVVGWPRGEFRLMREAAAAVS